MSLTLTAVQRRVLGVLIEKSFATPDQYPLTLNAIVVGCNQKSNRNPTANYAESEVANVLQELIHMELVQHADVPRIVRWMVHPTRFQKWLAQHTIGISGR